MIDGLKIDVASDELVTILTDLAATYRAKGDAIQRQLVAFANSGIVVPAGSSNDAAHDLEQRKAHYTQKVRLYEFLAAHVVPSEMYRLSEGDLVPLDLREF